MDMELQDKLASVANALEGNVVPEVIEAAESEEVKSFWKKTKDSTLGIIDKFRDSHINQYIQDELEYGEKEAVRLAAIGLIEVLDCMWDQIPVSEGSMAGKITGSKLNRGGLLVLLSIFGSKKAKAVRDAAVAKEEWIMGHTSDFIYEVLKALPIQYGVDKAQIEEHVKSAVRAGFDLFVSLFGARAVRVVKPRSNEALIQKANTQGTGGKVFYNNPNGNPNRHHKRG
jgi:hypothetical protein